jgi:hypothetical protein
MMSQDSSNSLHKELKLYRTSLIVFIFGLIVSGLTAFPLLLELRALCHLMGIETPIDYQNLQGIRYWVAYVYYGLETTYAKFPFIGYGTDWLAFAHLIIALFFIKPLVEPETNLWVLKYGIIACICVIPLALIAGEVRGIPIYWRLIDCSFGIFGAIPLIYCLKLAQKMGIKY